MLNSLMSYRSLGVFVLLPICASGVASCSEESCFAAGTRIDTPAGALPIEALQDGDLVWSYDHESRRRVPSPISRTFRHRHALVRELRLANGNVLWVTKEHPFYVPERRHYAPASSLSTGTELRTFHAGAVGETSVLSFPKSADRMTVYNLEVAGFHNYFAEGVLVHNKSFLPPDGGVPEMGAACEPPASRCENWPVDGIEEDLSCAIEPTPKLTNACAGTESVMNPASCTSEGQESTYRARFLALAGSEYFPELGTSIADCNAGFDLDGCDGTSCDADSNFTTEGMGGVDNGIASLGASFRALGTDLSQVNQALYDGLCAGVLELSWILAPNLGESCVNVTLVIDGTPADEAIPMNLSDDGCASGTLGVVPLPIAGTPSFLANTVIRGTIDLDRGFDVELGGTLDKDSASALMEAVIEGGGAAVDVFSDINGDLRGDNNADCTAMSVTFDMRAAP